MAPRKRGRPLVCNVRDQEAPGTFMVKLDSDGLGAKTGLTGYLDPAAKLT